jgi:hypothetical protein
MQWRSVRQRIRYSPIYPCLNWLRTLYRKILRILRISHWAHRKLHNDNQFFYTLSPMLLTGIHKAFNMQQEQIATGGKNLLEGHGYYEFGLFRGFSFWFSEQISREIVGDAFNYYGFDSFEGLPQTEIDSEEEFWAEGNYSASYEFVMGKLKANGSDLSKVRLYKGFYSKEYFESLQTDQFLPISICVIDSDIYESCVDVLEFIKSYIVPGSIILFDDYNAFDKDDDHGERRALREFESRNPSFRKEHLFDFGWHGVAFRVL